MPQDYIRVRGARQHNLKNVDVDIPRHKLVVLTGVSGSGKSSLAFDTLYAEGQRRYVQSLSAYARQFIEQLEKPQVDFIEGLSPAVAIEQRHGTPNPRSTIATVTEVYDYLRVLYAVAGQPHDPETGERLVKNTPEEIGEKILSLQEGTRVVVLAPLVRDGRGDLRGLLEKLRRQGFVRVRLDGQMVELEESLKPDRHAPHTVEAVVDRLVIRPDVRARLMESIESALKWNATEIAFATDDEVLSFTTSYANPRTGFVMESLTPQHFSFNTHHGACPECEGVGTVMTADPGLIVPDAGKSLAQAAVKTWWGKQPKLRAMFVRTIESLAKHCRARMDLPFEKLSAAFKEALFHGTGDKAIETGWQTSETRRSVSKPFEGMIHEANRLWKTATSEALRSQLSRFMNPRPCPVCEGRRLNPLALSVKLEGGEKKEVWKNIHEYCSLSIQDALAWLESLRLTEHQRAYCDELRSEIRKRLRFLEEVGLGYLALNRESGTLSGGEVQRIRLATQIGAGLAGVLYVLDEPSIGLHPVDNERLIRTLHHLRDLGNTVLVVEHDEAMMHAADWIVELGPAAGVHGGTIVATGAPADIAANEQSRTGDYLSGRLSISPPGGSDAAKSRNHNSTPVLFHSNVAALTVHGAREHNLKEVTVSFPLGKLTCVTGPSGSGKSTLIDDILMRALMRHFYHAKEEPGAHGRISGLEHLDKVIVIDQTSIGRSPRSNPATYTGVFTPIREVFAQLPLSRVRGYEAGRFSFNTPGGRCEKCDGDGVIKIDMHFLADVYVTCELCKGQRYNRETLEIAFKGKNIAEVLDMTVSEAARFFEKQTTVYPKLRAMEDTGLGYLRLGQSGASLSGGEAQRVKLAAELGKKATGRTLFLLDEPTTGLHFADIQTLLAVLFRLRDAGNTLIIIEHNLDVIRCADHVIDLGPGGGDAGGRVLATGSPAEIAAMPESVTGKFLALNKATK